MNGPLEKETAGWWASLILRLAMSSLFFAAAVAKLKGDYHFWETEQFDRPGYPKLHFIEGRYAADPTNWWVPNRACAEAMLRSAGFAITDHPEEEVYICRHVDAPRGAAAVYPAKGRHA